MKYLLVLLVVACFAWLLIGRRRGGKQDSVKNASRADSRVSADKPVVDAVTMVACAHCGVHLPAADLVFDAVGRPFCSEAHRVAGPR
jgi:uncharacterized protein